MRMKLLSPFRCHLNIANANALSDEEAYARHWKKVRHAVALDVDQIPWIGRVEFLHAGLAPMAMRFQNLSHDGSFFPPELLQIRPPADAPIVPEADVEAAPVLAALGLEGLATPIPETLVFRVYDNTIAIGELALDVAEDRFSASPSTAVDALQKYSNKLMETIVRRFYYRALYPLVVAVWRGDAGGKFIEVPGSYTGFPDLTVRGKIHRGPGGTPGFKRGVAGQILWVNRSLYTAGLDPSRREPLLDHWLPLATSEDHVRELARRPGTVFLGWGHNLFDAPEGSAACDDGWYSLLLCQYFYSVLDCTNAGLSHFIGTSLSGLSLKETHRLNSRLQDVVSSVQLVTTQFHDTQQNLQGTRRAYFNDLASRWGMSALTENVEKKIRIVTQLIERLFQRSTRLNQMIVEVMLFAIGGISLVSFGLTVSEYARSKDPSPGADGFPGVLDVGLYLAPDALISGCIGLLVVLLTIFLVVDRQSKR